MGLFIERLYTTRGRRLREHPWAAKDGELPVTRLVIAGVDHVFYPRDASGPHQQHIVLREMAARALTRLDPRRDGSAEGLHPLHGFFPDLPEGLMDHSLPQLPLPPEETAVEHLATLMGCSITPRLASPGRVLAALEPLRRALPHGAAPAIAATTRDVYLYRQVIDINDALWQLRRYLSARVREHSNTTVVQAGFQGEEAAAVAASIEWRAAICARRRGHDMEKQLLSLPPGGTDFEAEASRLVSLAHAFHRRPAPAIRRAGRPAVLLGGTQRAQPLVPLRQ
ncbi:DUF6545 domain-containing protein [Streptomyces mirabilis]|uniref:DUF6545 domain-containing protein n=1 Tax=Streptomyces mirabilis TaxID=68239 RepID=UPI0033FF97C3